jgi:hypothetical protein
MLLPSLFYRWNGSEGVGPRWLKDEGPAQVVVGGGLKTVRLVRLRPDIQTAISTSIASKKFFGYAPNSQHSNSLTKNQKLAGTWLTADSHPKGKHRSQLLEKPPALSPLGLSISRIPSRFRSEFQQIPRNRSAEPIGKSEA